VTVVTEILLDVPMLYEQFFRLGGPPPSGKPQQYRRRVTSMRLPACLLLAELVRTRRPARVLDLGSGLTSYVLRALKTEFPDMAVVTTDTAERWLKCTIAELRRDGMDSAFCFTQAAFEDWKEKGVYDLISVDAGNTAYRFRLAPLLLSWLAPGGVVVLDDWHLEHYAAKMGDLLIGEGFTVTPRPDTLDEFGGFVALAERTQ
jgi:predicted O-methyltransferase YrrM